MNLITTHDANHADPFMRPSFGLRSKLARLCWGVVYVLLFRPSPRSLHNWRCFLLRLFGARIGRDNFIYPKVKIWAPWLLHTEEVVTIADGAEIYNPGGISLGHHTIISQDAYLCGATHDYNSPDFNYVMKTIRTEAYVWICARAIVLPGVSCGCGSVLGAGSVTSRSMDAWCVYAGNPARMVKERKRVYADQLG
jgi:putative colanic acid biosynthesis acetyltransferase WcaF